MRFSVLASGSRGNAFYVETENTSILIDAGISCREIERRLDTLGVKARKLNAIMVTHEHSDHIKGAGPLSRRFGLPLYLNRKTYNKSVKALGDLSKTVIIETGQTIYIRDMQIETFTKCHDAVDPFGLTVSFDGVKIGIATDLGKSTRLVEERLRGCQALVMEFNHDMKMLEEGPYPLDLKRRIKSAEGHLSNQQAIELLEIVSGEKTECVVLAHISETNNNPNNARWKATEVLQKKGLIETRVILALQDEPCPLININS